MTAVERQSGIAGLRCARCGTPLTRQEVAASVATDGDETVWCLPCWDNPDEVALDQYRASFGSAERASTIAVTR